LRIYYLIDKKVLHLLALAKEAEVDLTIADFNRVGEKVPLIGNFKPFGEYLLAVWSLSPLSMNHFFYLLAMQWKTWRL
jgi:hypothetical protein